MVEIGVDTSGDRNIILELLVLVQTGRVIGFE